MALFTPLPSNTEGRGPFHINRYRVYFRPVTEAEAARGVVPNGRPQDIAADLATKLRTGFPSVFNPNAAKVGWRSEQWGGHKTLRFELTAKLFGIDHTVADWFAPDAHADWVGIHKTHPHGFTVQTLKREFWTWLDGKMAIASGGGGALAGGGVGALGGAAAGAWWFGVGAGPGALVGAGGGAVVGGVTGMASGLDANAYHFLAGRRAWAIGTKAQFGRAGVENYDAIPDDALALETGAVERLSHWVYDALDTTRILGKFSTAVHQIWVKFMTNYLARTGYQPVPVRVWGNAEGPVSFFEPKPIETYAAIKGHAAVGDMARIHKDLLPA